MTRLRPFISPFLGLILSFGLVASVLHNHGSIISYDSHPAYSGLDFEEEHYTCPFCAVFFNTVESGNTGIENLPATCLNLHNLEEQLTSYPSWQYLEGRSPPASS